ncbi:DUF4189 domain-containing protein [Neisseria sp. P0001.S005]|uniref:DUF4189 domain-containing protein n=2 Tax=unclassified Neisseria TaxID=2623750 RepID=UPI003F81F93D
MKKLLTVLLGFASLDVYANGCGGEYQPATGTCRIIDSSGRQILYNVGRPNGYTQSQPSVVNIDVPSKYGAWAVNPKTGISGGALDMDSLAAAKELAIKTCEEGGKNKPCKVKAWVRNGCIAVAQRKDGKAFFGITSPGLAETEALRKCQASGRFQCIITTPEGCSMPKF